MGVVYLGEFGVPKTTSPIDTMVWTRCFAIEPVQASECVRLYQLLGDEVLMEPARPDLLIAEGCGDCFLADCRMYLALYTRPADVRTSGGT